MISTSAQILAARRALATQQNQALVNDPISQIFVSEKIQKQALASDDSVHYVLMRHKFIEDVLTDPQKHWEQVIVMAAGLDTKFQRHDFLKNISYLEIDSKEMITFKTKTLKEHNFDVPNTLALSLKDKNDLKNLFEKFSKTKKTLILAEGLFMYTNQSLVETALLEAHSYFKDFEMLFDVLDTNQKTDDATHKMITRLKEQGEILKTKHDLNRLKTIIQAKNLKFETYFPEDLCQKYYQKPWHRKNHICVCHVL